MSYLKELRISKNMTQAQASAVMGISLRSYKEYENNEKKSNTMKYKYMVEFLESFMPTDEEHGVLTFDEIKNGCKEVLDEYDVSYCILFGSYAKGSADGKSDVDLLISTEARGLKFYGIAERLRIKLRKKIDLLDIGQLSGNPDLINEILKDGIRIYG